MPSNSSGEESRRVISSIGIHDAVGAGAGTSAADNNNNNNSDNGSGAGAPSNVSNSGVASDTESGDVSSGMFAWHELQYPDQSSSSEDDRAPTQTRTVLDRLLGRNRAGPSTVATQNDAQRNQNDGSNNSNTLPNTIERSSSASKRSNLRRVQFGYRRSGGAKQDDDDEKKDSDSEESRGAAAAFCCRHLYLLLLLLFLLITAMISTVVVTTRRTTREEELGADTPRDPSATPPKLPQSPTSLLESCLCNPVASDGYDKVAGNFFMGETYYECAPSNSISHQTAKLDPFTICVFPRSSSELEGYLGDELGFFSLKHGPTDATFTDDNVKSGVTGIVLMDQNPNKSAIALTVTSPLFDLLPSVQLNFEGTLEVSGSVPLQPAAEMVPFGLSIQLKDEANNITPENSEIDFQACQCDKNGKCLPTLSQLAEPDQNATDDTLSYSTLGGSKIYICLKSPIEPIASLSFFQIREDGSPPTEAVSITPYGDEPNMSNDVSVISSGKLFVPGLGTSLNGVVATTSSEFFVTGLDASNLTDVQEAEIAFLFEEAIAEELGLAISAVKVTSITNSSVSFDITTHADSTQDANDAAFSLSESLSQSSSLATISNSVNSEAVGSNLEGALANLGLSSYTQSSTALSYVSKATLQGEFVALDLDVSKLTASELEEAKELIESALTQALNIPGVVLDVSVIDISDTGTITYVITAYGDNASEVIVSTHSLLDTPSTLTDISDIVQDQSKYSTTSVLTSLSSASIVSNTVGLSTGISLNDDDEAEVVSYFEEAMTQSLQQILPNRASVVVTDIQAGEVQYKVTMTLESCADADSTVDSVQTFLSQTSTLASISDSVSAASSSSPSTTVITTLSALNIESNTNVSKSDCAVFSTWDTSLHPHAAVELQPDGLIIELDVNEIFPSTTSTVFQIDGVANVGGSEQSIEMDAYLSSIAATALEEQLGLSNTREVVVCVCDRSAPSPVISLEDSSIEALQCPLEPLVITPGVSEVTLCLFSRLPMESIRFLSIRHPFGPTFPLFANGFNMIPSMSKSKLSETRAWVRVNLPPAFFKGVTSPTEGLILLVMILGSNQPKQANRELRDLQQTQEEKQNEVGGTGQIFLDVESPTMLPSALPTTFPSTSRTSSPSSLPSHKPFSQPSPSPSKEQSSEQTNLPTGTSSQPSSQPSSAPSSQPSSQPSAQPSSQPSSQPSAQPSSQPSSAPSSQPSSQPSSAPSSQPSSRPSVSLSPSAKVMPSLSPTSQVFKPSSQPSVRSSVRPSRFPSNSPSALPVFMPSSKPTGEPSLIPSRDPSLLPSSQPSLLPSNPDFCLAPTNDGENCQLKSALCFNYTCVNDECVPTYNPSETGNDCLCGKCVEDCLDSPTCFDYCEFNVTIRLPPSVLYLTRTDTAAEHITVQWNCKQGVRLNETVSLSVHPVLGEVFELKKPQTCGQQNLKLSPFFDVFYDGSKNVEIHTSCSYPIYLGQPICDELSTTDPGYCVPLYITGYCNTRGDLESPPVQPSNCGYYNQPHATLSAAPSSQPTTLFSPPTQSPTPFPSTFPSFVPTDSVVPTQSGKPSTQPSFIPSSSISPTNTVTSRAPSQSPSTSSSPSMQPSALPTLLDTSSPSALPSSVPTDSGKPSTQPSFAPSLSLSPTNAMPTTAPSQSPSTSSSPSTMPSSHPSITASTSRAPSKKPSGSPSLLPSIQPTDGPSSSPSESPSGKPSVSPSIAPSLKPSISPSIQPTDGPSGPPSLSPSIQPTDDPTSSPSESPSDKPSVSPSITPSSKPSVFDCARFLSNGDCPKPRCEWKQGTCRLPGVRNLIVENDDITFDATYNMDVKKDNLFSVIQTVLLLLAVLLLAVFFRLRRRLQPLA